jgi:O-acetyl-ADP-ribose deacetylase
MRMAKEKMQLYLGDITMLQVDAIVNAANSALSAGAGVCGAIHRAAGPELEAECHRLEGCQTGSAKITKGYNLKAKHVIHAVGPIWQGGNNNEAKLLASAYTKSLALAVANGLKTIAFPAISCGIYGYPIEQAASVAVSATAKFLTKHPELNKVIFVCFDDSIYQAYQRALEKCS